MKKVTRTILKWDFNSPCGQPRKPTTVRTPDGNPYILEVVVTLEGDKGRLQLAMFHFYPWQPIYCDAVKEALARVPELLLKNEHYEVQRYDLNLYFKRVPGEEFTATAVKRVVALFKAMLSEDECILVWWPAVHQETLVQIDGKLIPYGNYLAIEFYPNDWAWRNAAMTDD